VPIRPTPMPAGRSVRETRRTSGGEVRVLQREPRCDICGCRALDGRAPRPRNTAKCQAVQVADISVGSRISIGAFRFLLSASDVATILKSSHDYSFLRPLRLFSQFAAAVTLDAVAQLSPSGHGASIRVVDRLCGRRIFLRRSLTRVEFMPSTDRPARNGSVCVTPGSPR
jgi:hypothetical protein